VLGDRVPHSPLRTDDESEAGDDEQADGVGAAGGGAAAGPGGGAGAGSAGALGGGGRAGRGHPQVGPWGSRQGAAWVLWLTGSGRVRVGAPCGHKCPHPRPPAPPCQPRAALPLAPLTLRAAASLLALPRSIAPSLALQGPQWVLFNDFAVQAGLPPSEVTATYDGQKLPALLHYKEVRRGGAPGLRARVWPCACACVYGRVRGDLWRAKGSGPSAWGAAGSPVVKPPPRPRPAHRPCPCPHGPLAATGGFRVFGFFGF
jgi:hypothetical protein